MTSAPIADGIYTDEVKRRLIGGREHATGRMVFPCPSGNDASRFDAVPLSRHGRVWSYTMQRFRPKSPPYRGPKEFVPFVMAYVELPEVIVATRLIAIDLQEVHIGLEVELCFVPLDPLAPERDLIHAFRPVAGAVSS